MNTSDRVQITIKLDRIDRDNFLCKAKNSPLKTMQNQTEYMIKQYLYGGNNEKVVQSHLPTITWKADSV